MSKKSTGRPFDQSVNNGIEAAATWLLISKGFENITVSEIVEEAGTTRATFYRRYSSLIDLVTTLLTKEFSTKLQRDINTGSLHHDLEQLQEEELAFFLNPMVRRSMPGFLGALRSDDGHREIFWERFMKPRRISVADMLRRAERRGEIPGGYDTDLICDLLVGPFFVRTSVPNAGLVNRDLVKHIRQIVLKDLDYKC